MDSGVCAIGTTEYAEKIMHSRKPVANLEELDIIPPG
jgi:hypothetical protein